MKKFLIKISLFFSSAILFCYFVQYMIDTGLEKYDNDRYINLNRLFRSEINSDIIILGSSRAWVQFDPEVIEEFTKLSCYNLGADAAGMTIIKCWFDSYLAYNRPPKLILLNYEINILRKEKRIFNKIYYLPFLSKQPVYRNLEEIDKNILIERILPLYKYRGVNEEMKIGLKSFFNYAPKPVNSMYKGYKGQDKKWNTDFYKIKAKRKRIYYPGADFGYGIKVLQYIMNTCKKNNIDFLIVHSPIYYELQQMITQQDSVDSVIYDLAEKNGFQYWKFTSDSLNFDKKYYYNAQHLNKSGAEIFSRELAKDLTFYLRRKLISSEKQKK